MASGGMETHTPKISVTTIGMTIKILPNVDIYKEAQNQKNLYDLSSL